jgi:hypothetical protein
MRWSQCPAKVVILYRPRTGTPWFCPCQTFLEEKNRARMAIHLLLGFVLWLAVDVNAKKVYTIGRGITYPCFSTAAKSDVGVFFDLEGEPSSKAESESRAQAILKSLLDNGVYGKASLTIPVSLTVVPDTCSIDGRKGSFSFPDSLYQSADVDFGVVRINPGSAFFKTSTSSFASAYSYLSRKKNSIELLMGPHGDQEKIGGCHDGNRMFPEVLKSSPDQWQVGLDGMGLISDNGYIKFNSLSKSARLSTLVSGMVLPSPVFDEFVSQISKSKSVSVTKENDELKIQNCYSDPENLTPGLWDMVLSLSGQNGYSMRLRPDMYLDPIEGTNDCLIKVQRGKELIFGDSFFRSGYVELKADYKMVVCPQEQYHETDPAFNFGLPDNKRPAPRGGAGDEADGVVDIRTKTEGSETLTKVLIGSLVGGAALIAAVVGFFIWRAKRRSIKDRDDPNRAMVRDPSVVSDTSSVRV